MQADGKSTAPPGADFLTPGDFLKATGAELLRAHEHLQRARELLIEWRVRVPSSEWLRELPREVRHGD
jgi:hypothetical protein